MAEIVWTAVVTESFRRIGAAVAERLAQLYDITMLGIQRVNRAELPHTRAAGGCLLVWVGSSVAGGTPPLLGPYFAARAGRDALAVCYARELAPFGIETSIILPGASTKGTNNFLNAGIPGNHARVAAYDAGYPSGFTTRMKDALATTVPEDADPDPVARAVAAVVDVPFGSRPVRGHVDPADNGAAFSFAVIDRLRTEFLHRIGFAELLHSARVAA